MESSKSDGDLSKENMGKIKVERDVGTELSRSDGNWFEGNIKVDEYADTIKVKQENNLDPEGETFPGIKPEAIFLKIEDNGSGTGGKIKVERGVYTESSRCDVNWWERNIKVDEDVDTKSYDSNSYMGIHDKLELEKILDPEGEMFPDVEIEELILKHEDKGSGTGDEDQAVLKNTGYVSHRKQNESKKCHCNYCDFETTTKSYLKKHVQFMHDSKWHQCDHCDFRTKNKWYLKKHAITTHEKGSAQKFLCSHCEYSTIYKHHLKNHIALIHQTESAERFFCYHCEYNTIYKHHLKNHIVLIHQTRSAKKILCDRCDFKTTMDSYLKMHVKRKHGSGATEIYRCDRCDFRSKSKSYMNIHVRKKHRLGVTEIHHCDHCQFVTKTKIYLKRHVKRMHVSGSAEKFVCYHCKFKTIYKHSLMYHIKHCSREDTTVSGRKSNAPQRA